MSPADPPSGIDVQQSAPRWIVLKFGGTSVSERKRWDTIGALIRARAGRGDARVLTVVSALAGITNALQGVIDAHADDRECAERVAAIVQRHRAFALTLDLDPDAVLGQRLPVLDALLVDRRRSTASLDWQAEL
ncbi:MAG TPA: bifunctional aspartate kinase/diaminopimelate decarboxylase, partial [Xanthomonadaceae bacterium]|nr:bifunctional aspartate kinase/diaminopimelate decarboxylase [Xanthomonadaceae bacterium]